LKNRSIVTCCRRRSWCRDSHCCTCL